MFASIFRFFFLLVVMLLFQSTTTAQNILSSANKTITQKQFFELILKYHPIAKQSSLLTERGKKIIQQSKGAFDPQFYTYFDEKYFSSKNLSRPFHLEKRAAQSSRSTAVIELRCFVSGGFYGHV